MTWCFTTSTPGAITAAPRIRTRTKSGSNWPRNEFASSAKRRVDDVLRRSLAALANTSLIPGHAAGVQSAELAAFLPGGNGFGQGTGAGGFGASRPVPYEILSSGTDYDHVRFLAQDVPSVGYKAYAIKSTSESPADAPATLRRK